MLKINKISAYGSLVFFALGLVFFGSGYYYYYQNEPEQNCIRQFEYLNPRLECGEKPKIDKSSYLLFENRLKEKLDLIKKSGTADLVSVYFRDLQSGPIFGVDEDIKFIPASLLKLPTMMAYFHIAEGDDSFLDRTLAYDPEAADKLNPLKQYVFPEETIKPDKPYKIYELIERMISNSDNAAMNVLYNYMVNSYSPNINLISEVFKDFGLAEPNSDLTEETMSARTYSSFFRILYNSSYLSNEYSDLALKYLSETKYQGGLRRGVPDGVTITHKIGERSMAGRLQLHDCGIIYYPDNPYLLCVMTAGSDFSKLDEIISTISGLVYEEVDSRKL